MCGGCFVAEGDSAVSLVIFVFIPSPCMVLHNVCVLFVIPSVFRCYFHMLVLCCMREVISRGCGNQCDATQQ